MTWLLWGSHPNYAGGVPIKLAGGTLNDCLHAKRRRTLADSRWKLAIYKAGTEPVGLRLQVEA